MDLVCKSNSPTRHTSGCESFTQYAGHQSTYRQRLLSPFK